MTGHRTSPRELSVVVALILILGLAAVAAQSPGQTDVPRLIRFAGSLPGGASTRMVTLGIFSEPDGGAALWSETQTVTTDATGRFIALLGAGSTAGLPLELFASGEARWLGVAAEGLPDQPRVMLVSVPYALKAEDAATIGGKPLAAFVLAGDKTGIGADGLNYVDTRVLRSGIGAPAGGSASTLGSPGYLGVFTDTVNLGNSVLFQSGTSVGVNTTSPEATMHVKGSSAPAAFFDVYSNSLSALPGVYRAARGTIASPAALGTNDIIGGLAVRGYNGSAFTGGRGQVMFRAAEPWTTTSNGTYLQIQTTPIGSITAAERVRVTPGGFVGIGTSPNAPSFPLEVANMNGATHASFGGAHNGLFLISDMPQVGFNLSYPEGAFNWVYGSSTYGGYLAFGQDTTGGFSFATAPSGTAGSTVRPSVRMVVTNAGNVGIGTTAPAYKLDVSGTIRTNGGLNAESAYIYNSTTNGVAIDGVANYGSTAWGVHGVAAEGQGVRGYSDSGVGVYGGAGTYAGRGGVFSASSSAGTALAATVAGTDVLTVDANGIHAGPAMTGTPLAHGLVNSVAGHELDYVHTSNVVAATWTATGVCEITIAGVTLSYFSDTILVTPFGNTPGFVTFELLGNGHLRVFTFASTGVAATRVFTFTVLRR